MTTPAAYQSGAAAAGSFGARCLAVAPLGGIGDVCARLASRQDPEYTRQVLVAIAADAPRVDPDTTGDLVPHALWGFDWGAWGAEETMVDAYVDMVLALVEHNGHYVRAAVDALCAWLAPAAPGRQAAMGRVATAWTVAPLAREVRSPRGVPLGTVCAPPEEVMVSVHGALRDVLECAPLAASSMFPALESIFPHRARDAATHAFVIGNVLRVTSYARELRPTLLALVVDKLVQIDVEIRLEDAPDEDDDEDELVLQFDVGEGAIGGQGHGQTHDQASVDVSLGVGGGGGRDSVDVMAEKLDSLMGMMFEYLDDFRADPAECDSIFHALMSTFADVLLTTHRSKYTQYLLFYMCSFAPGYTERFLAHLHEILFDVSRHPLMRQSCAAYIGSLLSRARFIATGTVRRALTLLCQWLSASMEHALGEAESRRTTLCPDPTAHGVFYSVCQAVFYTFCFLRRDLLAEDPEWVRRELDFRALVTSPLNPLRVCHRNVVREFARALRSIRHPSANACLQTIAANRRIGMGYDYHSESESIDAFFPFDPYLLLQSSPHITPLYRDWQSTEADTASSAGDDRRRSSAASGHSGSPAAVMMQSPSYRERRMSTLSFASDNSLDLPSDMSDDDDDDDLDDDGYNANGLGRLGASGNRNRSNDADDDDDDDDDAEDSYASGLSGTAGLLRRRSSEEEAWPTS